LFELSVAMKHIKTRRRQTLLAVGAVGLAVAITILTRSVTNGNIETFFGMFFELAPHVLVTPKEGEDYIYLYKTLMENIWAISGVIAVSPSLSTTAILSYEDNVEDISLEGVIPSELDKVTRIGEKYMVAGNLNGIQDGRRIVLGSRVAHDLDVKLGEDVEMSFPDAKTLNLVVAGIFNTGIEEWDESAFVSLDTAREFLSEGDVITYVNIHLEDPYESDEVAAQISALGYEAESWRSLFPEFEETVEIETLSNNLIMILIIIIAAFGIANVMNMMVLEKTKEIGMLMAMGTSPAHIRTIFLIESGILGLFGGIFGSVLGYSVSAYLHSLEIAIDVATAPQPFILKFLVDPFDLVLFSLLALALSMIVGVYPAHKASQLDPVVALRG